MHFLKCRVIFVGMMSLLGGLVNVAATEIEQHNQSFSVMLGASRIIQTTNSKGSVLSVGNENDYPMLVQTKITPDNDMAGSVNARFIATPPLFRLDGNQRAKLRITHVSGSVAHDRESLFWVCVKGVPPSTNDNWSDGNVPNRATLNVQMVINNCIKLLVRPKDLVGQDALAMAEQLIWRQEGHGLIAVNPTPFYINLSKLSVGGVPVENVRHIAPFSSHTFSIPAGAKGKVQWSALTDLGGDGPLLTSVLN